MGPVVPIAKGWMRGRREEEGGRRVSVSEGGREGESEEGQVEF